MGKAIPFVRQKCRCTCLLKQTSCVSTCLASSALHKCSSFLISSSFFPRSVLNSNFLQNFITKPIDILRRNFKMQVQFTGIYMVVKFLFYRFFVFLSTFFSTMVIHSFHVEFRVKVLFVNIIFVSVVALITWKWVNMCNYISIINFIWRPFASRINDSKNFLFIQTPEIPPSIFPYWDKILMQFRFWNTRTISWSWSLNLWRL